MIPLEPGYYYHIYNHANGNEDIFKEDRNYIHFLDKYKKYILPVADTFAYCLMKNHFHFLVRIKEARELTETSDVLQTSDVSNAFKNLFQSYTKAINKSYNRKGSLFNQRFKRTLITTDKQLQDCLIYIHLNPVIHGFTKLPEYWKYSSFGAYLKNNGKTLLKKQEAIEWFENLQNFIECHTIARARKFGEDL